LGPAGFYKDEAPTELDFIGERRVHFLNSMAVGIKGGERALENGMSLTRFRGQVRGWDKKGQADGNETETTDL
jgi:hypothetical protein